MNATDAKVTTLDSIDLRGLAELSAPERAFTSLYVSSPASLRQLAGKIERVRAFLGGEEAESEHFEESIKLVQAWLEENAPEEFEGIAVFASWALDFVHGYVLPLQVPDLLRVEASPYLRPLAELRDEYETFAVVAADNDATRIFVVTSAVVEEEERVNGGVKNHVKKGGWSQKRYSRRRENELLHYSKAVVERLQELDEEHELARIVLLGSTETIHEIRENLPKDLESRVAGEKAVDLHDGEEVLLDEAFEVFFGAEREAEQALWERIREQGLSEGLAVTGPTAVLSAVAVGKAEEILLDREAKISGTRCRECENVVHGTPATCQICGASSVFKVDLGDELVHLAETTGARVEFSDPLPGLDRAGGVAALLRY